MAGILDGAFGGGGTGILPDWLFNSNGLANVGPDMTAYGTPGMPTVPMQTLPPGVPSPGMTADMPFADRWNPTMQAMASGAFDPQGANNNIAYETSPRAQPPQMAGLQTFPGGNLPMPQPRPEAAQAAYERGLVTPGGELPPETTPTAGAMPRSVGLPVSSSASLLNPPPAGNPVAGGGDFMSRVGDWINNNRNALALFGAGIAGGGGTGSWNAGMGDALRGLVTGGRVDSEQRRQQAAQQYISNATDIDPQRKAAMLANPALAALYLGARAKRPYAGAPGMAPQRPVGYDWADVRDTSKGLQPRANAPEPGGSIIGKPGETIIGYGEWQTLPNGARIRQMK